MATSPPTRRRLNDCASCIAQQRPHCNENANTETAGIFCACNLKWRTLEKLGEPFTVQQGRLPRVAEPMPRSAARWHR